MGPSHSSYTMPSHSIVSHTIISHPILTNGIHPIPSRYNPSHPIISIPSHPILPHPIIFMPPHLNPSHHSNISHTTIFHPDLPRCIYPILRCAMPCHAMPSPPLGPGSPLTMPSARMVAAVQAGACPGVALLSMPIALAGPAGREAPVARLALVTLSAYSARLAPALPAHLVAQLGQ